jgi:hypothetical protein
MQTPALSKKPRATNALEVFANARKEEVRAELKARLTSEGIGPQEGNLKHHRIVKNELFSRLPSVERESFEHLATEYNKKIKGPPPVEHIYE